MTTEEVYREALLKISKLEEDKKLYGHPWDPLNTPELIAQSALRKGERCQSKSIS